MSVQNFACQFQHGAHWPVGQDLKTSELSFVGLRPDLRLGKYPVLFLVTMNLYFNGNEYNFKGGNSVNNVSVSHFNVSLLSKEIILLL